MPCPLLLSEVFAKGRVRPGMHVALLDGLRDQFHREDLQTAEIVDIEEKTIFQGKTNRVVVIKSKLGKQFRLWGDGEDQGDCGFGRSVFRLIRKPQLAG